MPMFCSTIGCVMAAGRPPVPMLKASALFHDRYKSVQAKCMMAALTERVKTCTGTSTCQARLRPVHAENVSLAS